MELPDAAASLERAAEKLPSVVIRYESLNYSIKQTIEQSNRTMATVPQVLAGAAASLPLSIARAVGALPALSVSKTELKIMDDVSGVIKPGSMTLLLSPPGGGKSTFLKAITSRMIPGTVTGKVTYSGLSPDELARKGIHLGQLCQYVDQLDNHMAYLSVRETFEFMAENSLAMSTPAQVKERVDEIIHLLHLDNCANTVVGNDLLRGISGGEKKRVTIGEGVLTNARFLALDEISTGLDAAVTFAITQSLRQRALSNRLGVVIALLQPTPEVYALFDDVILMREGAVVYHGKREALPEYLARLGFQPPSGEKHAHAATGVHAADASSASLSTLADDRDAMDMADWLTELITFPAKTHGKDVAGRAVVASGVQAIGLSLTPSPSVDQLPGLILRTLDDAKVIVKTPPFSTPGMVQAWKSSKEFATLMEEPKDGSVSTLELKTEFDRAQYGQAYVHNALVHTRSLVTRQFKLMGRNKLFIGFRVFSAVFMSIVFGGLYWNGKVEDGLAMYGLFLNAAMHVAFANISEMSSACSDKYIGYRHVAAGVHPAWTYPFAAMFAHLPMAAAESLAFGAIAYFMAGLTKEAGRFFFFTFVVLLCDVFASVLFRTFAYISSTLVAAQAGPMPIIAILIMFAGFMVTRTKMGWMQFLYYLDVFGYAIHSLAMNEFGADRYQIVPAAAAAAGSTTTLGEMYLTFFDMETAPEWKWGGVFFMVGATALVALWNFWAFANIRFDRNIGSARTPDESPPAGGVAVDIKGAGGSAASLGMQTSTSTTLATLPGRDSPVQNGEVVVSPLAQAAAAALASSTGTSTTVRSVLPFVPQTVSFKDLMYTVQLPPQLGGGSKTLLQGVSGYALPGRLLALMGASGAGKTTLLDVLGGRKNSGVQTGTVYLNGHVKDDRTFNRVAAYCEQQDLHYPLTTVREALEYSAELRLPVSVSAQQRSSFVDEVMDILELSPLAGRQVGDPGEADGLAPGERKRLTIGVELVSNAPVLFLDEPTSGLDSRAAAVVMRVIRNVASTGRTVICTIHQPSAELFFMFDDLLLLQRGGYEVYFGPLGPKSRFLLNHLEALPGVSPCPQAYNPATYMLDVLAGTDSSGSGATVNVSPSLGSDLDLTANASAGSMGDVPAAGKSSRRGPALKPTEFAAAYFDSALWVGEKGAGAVVSQLCTPAPSTTALAFDSPRARTFGAQYSILTRRQWLNYMRNIPFNIGRIVAITGLCLLFGTIYFGLAKRADDIAGVQSLVAAIFMTAAFAAMLNMDAALPTLVRTRPNFYREQASLMYDPGAFSLANATVELPWLGTAVLIGTSIAYFMIGLSPTPSVFFFHYLVTFLLAMTLVSFGHFVAAAMPSFDVAQAVIGTAAPILFLFGGMFSPPSKMPAGARWVNYIDPITYAFSSLVSTHMRCEGGKAAGCPEIVYPHPVLGPIPIDRDAYTKALYELNYDRRWEYVGYLALFVCAFQAIAVLAVRYIRHIVR